MFKSVTISGNLKYLRMQLGIGVGYLANSLRVSADSVWQWEAGRTIPQPSRIAQICEFYNNRLNWQEQKLTPERLLNEDLTARDISNTKAVAEQGPGYEHSESMIPGLRDFLNDKKLITLMTPSPEEIEILKGIRFYHGRYQPSKDFYVEILFDIRKSKEER